MTRRAWFVFAVLVLYAAALNPYYLPDTYDNVLYHGAARSIAAGEGYRFQGEVVTDWPPLFPTMLALLHLLGLHEVLAAKILVLVLAVGGVALAWRLAHEEVRPWPVLLVAGLALAPTGFQMGTRIMAEWPYMVASFAFLLVLRRVCERRDMPSVIASGLLLGVAGLTRYTGVFLMVAVGYEVVRAARARSSGSPAWRRVVPVVGVGAVGLGAWLGWAFYLACAAHEAQATVMEPQNLAASTYGDFHPFAVLHAAANLFFCTQSVLARIGVASQAVTGVATLLGVWGLAVRVRRQAFRASDLYALALLAFVAFYEHGEIPSLTRYLLPVGLFYLSWIFEGVRDLAGRLPRLVFFPARLGRLAAGAWLAALLSVDVGLLTVGKPGGPHGGLSVLASPTPESFYRGAWLDLYRACAFIRAQPEPGAVSGLPDSTRYLAAWTGRDLVETRNGSPVDMGRFSRVVFLVAPPDQGPILGFEPAARFSTLTVWRRSRSPD